jgi:hypothetical protein
MLRTKRCPQLPEMRSISRKAAVYQGKEPWNSGLSIAKEHMPRKSLPGVTIAKLLGYRGDATLEGRVNSSVGIPPVCLAASDFFMGITLPGFVRCGKAQILKGDTLLCHN